MSWRDCFRLRPILHDPSVWLPPGIFDRLSVRESSAGFWPQGVCTELSAFSRPSRRLPVLGLVVADAVSSPGATSFFMPKSGSELRGGRTPPLPNPRRSSAQRSPCRWAFLFGRSVEPLDRGRVSRLRLGKTPSLRRDRSRGAARSARAFSAPETCSPGQALSARANSRSVTMFE